jgi:hypothetical protein
MQRLDQAVMREKKEILEHLLNWMQKLRLTLRSIGMPPKSFGPKYLA